MEKDVGSIVQHCCDGYSPLGILFLVIDSFLVERLLQCLEGQEEEFCVFCVRLLDQKGSPLLLFFLCELIGGILTLWIVVVKRAEDFFGVH